MRLELSLDRRLELELKEVRLGLGLVARVDVGG